MSSKVENGFLVAGNSPDAPMPVAALSKLSFFLAARRAFAGKPVLEARFLIAALRHRAEFNRLASPPPGGSQDEYLRARPELLGVLLWPYQSATWPVAERARRIVSHFDMLDRTFPALRFPLDAKLLLADLEPWAPGWRICIEHPIWLQREGLFAISLFSGGYRAFSIAFSFTGGETRDLFIGGLQGRKADHALDTYKTITKLLHGVRPRDMMIETVRMLAATLGFDHIYAVADAHRYAQHPYFGGSHVRGPQLDYDAAWIDRGGVRIAPTHFELPVAAQRRTPDTVAASKRSLYRKRYEMLDAVEAQIARSLDARVLLRFEDF